MKVRTRRLVFTRVLLANSKAKTTANPLRTDPTRTSGMVDHFCRFVDRQFNRLKADVLRAVGTEDWLGVGQTISPTTNQLSLYRPFVCNGEVGYFSSRGLIEVPDVRQDEPTSCGAAAAMSVGKYFGVGPDALAQWKEALGTSHEGTHPEPIVKYLRSLSLQVEAFQHGNLGTLDHYLDRGWPVLCCVQDYGPKHTWEHGHYLVVIGHRDGYVFAQDPAMDNVMVDGHHKPVSELGSLHKPGRVMITEEEFVQAWHDEDEHGNPFVRFGIAVGPKVVANLNPYRDERGRFTSPDRDSRVKQYGRVLTSSTQDGYTMRIHSENPREKGDRRGASNISLEKQGQMTVQGPTGEVFPLGYWMDWAEYHYPKGHEDLPPVQRASIELEEQKKYGYKEMFLFEKHRHDILRTIREKKLRPIPGTTSDQKYEWYKRQLRRGGITTNCNPSQMRGADGRCGPGIGLDIPRSDMPQIRKDDMDDFLVFCQENGVKVQTGTVPASELKPTQKEFRQERVDALPYSVLKYTVLVSEDDYILDGTHRWIKHWQENKQSQVPVLRLGLPVREAIDLMRRFPKAQFVENTRWAFATSSGKLAAFGKWLRTRVVNLVSGKSMKEAWRRYVEAGWKKGAARAFDDTHQRQKWERHPDTVGTDLYTGGREEFLRSSFNHPESVEKVKLLAARTFTDLDGVTEAMSTKMTRTLADGLTMGQHPHQIAASLVRDVDGIGRRRALLVARHNLIYAHAEGQLDNLERLGVEEVGVAVEWATAKDAKVCPKCAALEGVVLKTKEAHGLLPLHVLCRCAWIPSFDPPSSPEEVEAAVQEGEVDLGPKTPRGTK